MYNTADDVANQKDVATGEGKTAPSRAGLAVEQQLTSTGNDRQGLAPHPPNFTWDDRDTNKVDNSQQLGLNILVGG